MVAIPRKDENRGLNVRQMLHYGLYRFGVIVFAVAVSLSDTPRRRASRRPWLHEYTRIYTRDVQNIYPVVRFHLVSLGYQAKAKTQK